MSEKTQTPLHFHLGQTSGQSLDQSLGWADSAVRIRESAAHGFLMLRGNMESEPFRQSVKQELGMELPMAPCTFSTSHHTTICWLGPSEWLIVLAGGSEDMVEARLREYLRGPSAIVDVSGGLALFNLSGQGADELLKKSCTYDFHPRQFRAGRCVQTPFAKANALVYGAGDGSFNVVIRRSYADYVAKWILDAAQEFGCCIES